MSQLTEEWMDSARDKPPGPATMATALDFVDYHLSGERRDESMTTRIRK